MLGSYMLSLIRTYVPLGVGSALTWLAVNLGVVIDEDSTATVVGASVVLVSAAYYALARALEKHYPKLSVLLSLGAGSAPVYVSAERAADRTPRM